MTLALALQLTAIVAIVSGILELCDRHRERKAKRTGI